MWNKIVAFFMSIIAFITSLFGGGVNYKAYHDVSYGSDKLQVYDLYIPTDKGDTLGLILYIHGGAWISGDKADYRNTIKEVASKKGYAAASVNYRFLTSGVTMQEILDDVNTAVNSIYDKAKSEGYTINKMITTGMSAGGHLALMYAYHTPSDSKIKPVAVCSMCGPTDLSDPGYYADGMVLKDSYLQLVASIAGQYATYEMIKQYTAPYSPVTYVETAVPTIIAHGQKDTIVPYSNAVTLDAQLTENGVTHQLITFPNSGHDLSSDPDCANAYYKAFEQYAANYLN